MTTNLQDLADRYLVIASAYETLTYAEIRNQVAELVTPLTKAQLKALAALTGHILISGESKAEWQEEFARAIVENKASFERCQFCIR